MKLALNDGMSVWVPDAKERSGFIKLEQRLYTRAKHIFVSADFVRRHLISEYQIPGDKITVVGMGVDDFFIKNMRTQLPPSPTKKCLFVGYTFYLKGGPDVLKAFAIAKKQLPDLTLLLVGPNYSKEMEQDGVIYIGPLNNREQLLYYYRSADLFLLPSLCDSFGFVFLEAMSQGLSCVGSKLNAMPEIINEGVTGNLIQPGDVDTLAELIISFYSNPEARNLIARNAQENVKKNFTWENVVLKIESKILHQDSLFNL